MKYFAWLLIAALALLPSAAFAIPLFQADDVVVEGGILTYNGAGGPLVGTGILFDELRGNNETPLNPLGVLTCDGCVAEFTSGANATEGVANGAPWAFGANPSLTAFTLTGAIPELGLPAGTILATASVSQAAVGVIDTDTVDFFAALTLGISDVNPALSGFFGLPNILVMSLTNAGQTITVGGDASLNLTSANNDAVFANPVQVPGIPVVAMLGLGLAIMFAVIPRRSI